MIGEKQIQEAIAYCNGKIDPTRSDAILLAACYILQDHFRDDTKMIENGYSFAAPVERAENYADDFSGDLPIGDYGESDFLQAVRGKRPAEVFLVIDDLMQTMSVVNPRVYDGVMRQIKDGEGR